MKTIFETGDKAFFLKEGSKVNINGTDFQFRFVASGTVASYNGNIYTVKDDKNPAVDYNVIDLFASEEEAKRSAKHLNENLLEDIRMNLTVIEANYL